MKSSIVNRKSAILILCIAVATAVQAGKTLTSTIQAEIKTLAETKWPDDYSMQAYEIKNQTKAFEKFQTLEKPSSMSTSTFDLIKSRAERKWPKDYDMQLFELNDQIDGWLKVNGK